MLTVSLHGIKIHAKIGLYPEEKITGNDFEIDVDVFIPVKNKSWPFIDYSVIQQIVIKDFQREGEKLETFVQYIHSSLKEKYPEAEKIRVAIRKMHPPLDNAANYAEVCFEG